MRIAVELTIVLLMCLGVFWAVLESVKRIVKEDLTQWHMHYSFRGKRGIDSFWIEPGPVMRRRFGKEWQYQRMTREQMKDWLASHQITVPDTDDDAVLALAIADALLAQLEARWPRILRLADAVEHHLNQDTSTPPCCS